MEKVREKVSRHLYSVRECGLFVLMGVHDSLSSVKV